MILHVRPKGLLTGAGIGRSRGVSGAPGAPKIVEKRKSTPIWPPSGRPLPRVPDGVASICALAEIILQKRYGARFCKELQGYANFGALRDPPLAARFMGALIGFFGFYFSKKEISFYCFLESSTVR